MEDAAATVKAYFGGSDKMKEEYGTFSWYAWTFMFFQHFNENKGFLASDNVEYSLARDSLPFELHDEFFYRSDVKKMLLELIDGHPSPMLEDVKINQIPSIEKIRTAITSAGFPRDDPLFMAKFTRQLMSYVRDIGYKMIQKSGLEPNTKRSMKPEIQKVINYCESLMMKYGLLVQLEPKDPRVTSLREWKAYRSDPYNFDVIRSLSRAVSNTGLDPSSVESYVYQTMRMHLQETGTSTLHDMYQQMVIAGELFS